MYTSILSGSQHLRVSSDTDNIDLAKYVQGGQLRLVLTVDSGVTLGSSTSTTPAVYSSSTIDKESLLIVRNEGSILGCNGAGGDGYGRDTGSGENGDNGIAGGDAIQLSCKINVFTALGVIEAGGGGGGGGAGKFTSSSNIEAGSGGGGSPGGTGGNGINQTDGITGTTAQYGPASGGGGARPGGACQGAGLAGLAGTNYGAGGGNGGTGGAAGNAINASGNTVTIISGAANITGAII